MKERPTIYCHKCGSKCSRLISGGNEIMGMNGGSGVYDFIDHNTTGQPVRIHNKRQWKEHLRQHGLNDDVQNDPYTKSQVEMKANKKAGDKQVERKKIKESVVEVYKNKRNSPEFKQRVKASISKDKSNKLLGIIK